MSDILKYDILVIGSLNADLVVKSPRFPQPGETISGEDLQIIPGGKGANQAVAAARQGVSVSMVGRVGNDAFGNLLLDNLKQNNVDVSKVEQIESATGTAVIVVDANGQNSIVLSPGANGQVTKEYIKKQAPALWEVEFVILQCEIPLDAVAAGATFGWGSDALVILNPAPAQEFPKDFLQHIDILIPNETELSILSGMPVTDIESAEKAAHFLQEGKTFTIIVTMGEKGALIVPKSFDGDVEKKVIHIPAFKVNVVDTTAAGDAFIGGFVSALLDNQSTPEAVRYGCACGALATTKFGAQPSLPTKEEVEKFLSQER